MNSKHTSLQIAFKIWIGVSVIISAGFLIGVLLSPEKNYFWLFIPLFLGTAIASLPALILLKILIKWVQHFHLSRSSKIIRLIIACFFIALFYGIPAGIVYSGIEGFQDIQDFFMASTTVTGILFVCAMLSLKMCSKAIVSYFTTTVIHHSIIQTNKMETTNYPEINNLPESQSNKNLIKGTVTGALIMIMLIPTLFISNLVNEREARQKEVAAEVSGKWASSQTLSGPFLYIPYKYNATDTQGKPIEADNHFWILPEDLQVTGTIDHQIRPRSIYKVLLYRAQIRNEGNFILNIPKDVDPNRVQWADARICYSLSDFKGIEERMLIKFNGTDIELSPGLPEKDIAKTGLSAPISLDIADIGKNIPFQSGVKIKGSEQLHFIPLGGNSSFAVSSDWHSPSFDGNNLPSERNVNDSGFSAKWVFNKANLPFGTILKDFSFDANTLAFGLTLLQPADQYAKTERTVKYAILIIGLTFSLFFIIEIMQKKPVHPVQYVLIGLALVIFYTLLLSISEFVVFDIAYLIAAISTILLISLYAKSHFDNWRSAGIFAGILTLLYGFIFVLIRLEDTALLIGSIGLFIILSIAMYASRKVNWYGKNTA